MTYGYRNPLIQIGALDGVDDYDSLDLFDQILPTIKSRVRKTKRRTPKTKRRNATVRKRTKKRRGRKTVNRRTKRTSRKSSSKKRVGKIYKTKKGQPYRIMANGRARFIKK